MIPGTKEAQKAWSSLKASITMPKKNNRNSHFKNSYADLGQVLAAIMPVAQEHGFLIQQSVWSEGGAHWLSTTVTHLDTGVGVASSSYPLIADKPGPQPMGSCITYARRYALKTLFDMVDVDDDGVSAHGQMPKSAELDRAINLINAAITVEDLKHIKTNIVANLPAAAHRAAASSRLKTRYTEIVSEQGKNVNDE